MAAAGSGALVSGLAGACARAPEGAAIEAPPATATPLRNPRRCRPTESESDMLVPSFLESKPAAFAHPAARFRIGAGRRPLLRRQRAQIGGDRDDVVLRQIGDHRFHLLHGLAGARAILDI